MLTAEQSRAARGWLDWTQDDLAKRAQVSLSTIRDFEKGRRFPIKNNLDAIRLSFEMAGIVFTFRGETPLGVQMTQPARRMLTDLHDAAGRDCDEKID